MMVDIRMFLRDAKPTRRLNTVVAYNTPVIAVAAAAVVVN
jgi:hypothetical protein